MNALTANDKCHQCQVVPITTHIQFQTMQLTLSHSIYAIQTQCATNIKLSPIDSICNPNLRPWNFNNFLQATNQAPIHGSSKSQTWETCYDWNNILEAHCARSFPSIKCHVHLSSRDANISLPNPCLDKHTTVSKPCRFSNNVSKTTPPSTDFGQNLTWNAQYQFMPDSPPALKHGPQQARLHFDSLRCTFPSKTARTEHLDHAARVSFDYLFLTAFPQIVSTKNRDDWAAASFLDKQKSSTAGTIACRQRQWQLPRWQHVTSEQGAVLRGIHILATRSRPPAETLRPRFHMIRARKATRTAVLSPAECDALPQKHAIKSALLYV